MSAAFGLMVLLLLGSGCSDDPIETKAPTVCTTDTCPAGWCTVTLRFDPNCVGKLTYAEILLNGALEPEAALVDGQFQSQGHTPVGEDATFFVRAEDWQWRIGFTCSNPAFDGDYTLACTGDGNTVIGPDAGPDAAETSP